MQQCVKDIAKEDFPSVACHVFAVYCTAPLTGIAIAGSFCSPDTFKKLKAGSKLAVNIVTSPFTGPIYITDTCLAGVETALFGEPLPILGNGPF